MDNVICIRTRKKVEAKDSETVLNMCVTLSNVRKQAEQMGLEPEASGINNVIGSLNARLFEETPKEQEKVSNLDIKNLNDVCRYLIEIQTELEKRGVPVAAQYVHKAISQTTAAMMTVQLSKRLASKERAS